MKNASLIFAGVAGFVAVVACCAGPTVFLTLGTLSLAAICRPIGMILPIILVLGFGVITYGLWRGKRGSACCGTDTQSAKKGS